jgi:hypothetical protein
MSVGLSLSQYKQLIVVPTLAVLGKAEPALNSAAAINLLTGTALVESNLAFLEQTPSGPAIGVDEIELATFNDIYNRYLNLDCNSHIKSAVDSFVFAGLTPDNQLHGNLYFGVAIARLKYWQSKLPMPSATDCLALATYHHDVYNAGGKAVVVTNTPLFKVAIES